MRCCNGVFLGAAKFPWWAKAARLQRSEDTFEPTSRYREAVRPVCYDARGCGRQVIQTMNSGWLVHDRLPGIGNLRIDSCEGRDPQDN